MLRGDDRFPHRGSITVNVGVPLDSRAIRKQTADDWQAALRQRDLARAQILRFCGNPICIDRRSGSRPPYMGITS